MAVVHAVLTGASAVPSSCPKLNGSFTALKPSARMRVTCELKSAVVLLDPCTNRPKSELKQSPFTSSAALKAHSLAPSHPLRKQILR